MLIRKATSREVKLACLHYHYARKVPVVHTAYSVFTDSKEFIGCVIFGYGANNRIGCPYDLAFGEVLELVRVAFNGRQGPGHTSEAVSMCVRQLHRDLPHVRLLISYADQNQSHTGILYQSMSWIYTGEGDVGDKQIYINGQKAHRRSLVQRYGTSRPEVLRKMGMDVDVVPIKPKHRYVFPLDKKMRRKVMKMSKPYPKEVGSHESVS